MVFVVQRQNVVIISFRVDPNLTRSVVAAIQRAVVQFVVFTMGTLPSSYTIATKTWIVFVDTITKVGAKVMFATRLSTIIGRWVLTVDTPEKCLGRGLVNGAAVAVRITVTVGLTGRPVQTREIPSAIIGFNRRFTERSKVAFRTFTVLVIIWRIWYLGLAGEMRFNRRLVVVFAKNAESAILALQVAITKSLSVKIVGKFAMGSLPPLETNTWLRA